MNGTTMQATEGAALQADWRSLCAQHTAYVDLPASPGKCLAAMQLIGAGYKFLVDHWCEIGLLVDGDNSNQQRRDGMLKAYQCTDEDLYAAESAEQAAKLCEEQTGEPCEEGYPRELGEEELDRRQPAFDEDERPVEGETTSVREMLAEHGDKPGWLAGERW